MSDRPAPRFPNREPAALRPLKREDWPLLGDPLLPRRTRVRGVRGSRGWRGAAAQGLGLRAWLTICCLTTLAACGDRDAPPARGGGERAFAGETLNAPPPPPPASDIAASPTAVPDPPSEPAAPAVGTLEWALAGPWRPPEERARDAARKPLELFAFMGVRPTHTVVETWPGGGWHAAILAPYLHEGGGRYVAAAPPAPAPAMGRSAFQERALTDALTDTLGAAALREALKLRFADPRLGPPPVLLDLGLDTPPPVLDPLADAVLSVNDVHVWLALGMAEKAFGDLYALVRPGGALTVVEYRAPENAPQDPNALNGYVRTSFVVRLAEEAGFTLEAQSAILANPKDDADHPFGVWTLAPFNRTSPLGEPFDPSFDRAPYDAVGEPDQMALLFRKPVE